MNEAPFSPVIAAAYGVLGILVVAVQVARGAAAIARWQARNQRADRLAA